ncbi:MAG: hypothetical protein K2M68_07210, partial [Muribaculaceae bacterium]|nr:hypothetical protein [Muribaculaceae bacterium]
MNKFFTALAAAAIVTTGVYADSEYKMTVTLTNGETVKYPVRNIESITFEEGVAPVNFASILEADYYGDKYDSNAGYFTLALTNIVNAEQTLFEA